MSNNKKGNNADTNDNSMALNIKATESTASLIEEERIVAKISVKTLSDRTIKLDFTDSDLTLGQLKRELVEHVELPVESQFFLLSGKVYGKDLADDSLRMIDLPGFKSPETVVSEFKAYEEKRKNASENNEESGANSAVDPSQPFVIIKGVEELLPTLYIFYYEPAAKALDPLEAATDWDQKNRLKFFKGLWAVSERNLNDAARFLVEALPTFEETGCIPYKELVKYAVITASVSFDRPSLKTKVKEIL